MSFVISTRTELIKTKRSAAFWLSFLGAGVIPSIFVLMYTINPTKNYNASWDHHFLEGWQAFSAFLQPMFVILICSLIPQIEYKNNTWKQVFASPQSIGNIFFSKYVAIIMMILFLFVMFNTFLIFSAMVPNLFYPKYGFLKNSIDWTTLLRFNVKSFISLLGIVSIQYWLSLRFRNFIVPIGIGLALLIAGLIALQWEHASKIPYCFPVLTFLNISSKRPSSSFLLNHELNSIGYFVFFTLLAFLDMKFRKERG